MSNDKENDRTKIQRISTDQNYRESINMTLNQDKPESIREADKQNGEGVMGERWANSNRDEVVLMVRYGDQTGKAVLDMSPKLHQQCLACNIN